MFLPLAQVINNYLDANEPQSEARLSRMHFHDNQRKVDYVLAYHYRKRGAHQGHGSPGHSLAVISNGETGKERPAGGPGDIELGPLDALEEERREQRDEFEHNLMAAGLELEKDLEVRLTRLQVSGWVGACGQCYLKKALLWQTACYFLLCKADTFAQDLAGESWYCGNFGQVVPCCRGNVVVGHAHSWSCTHDIPGSLVRD